MTDHIVKITSSPHCISEKQFVFDVMIRDFLKLDYALEILDEADGYSITFEEKQILIPDVFFDQIYKKDHKLLPEVEAYQTGYDNASLDKLPGWFANKQRTNDSGIRTLPVDVIGMAFFLMSGYADIHFAEKDTHQRRIGSTSFIAKKNLIDRPIIQEWFTVLAGHLFGDEELKPGKKLPAYSKHISHDVDQPFEYLNYSKTRLIKRLAGDVLVRKKPKKAKKRYQLYKKVKDGNYRVDPYNNFNEIVRLLEKHDLKSTFFFISGKPKSEYDAIYDIEHPAISDILKQVHTAGHEIGLHPSYKTRHNPDLLRKEVQKLRMVCKSLGIDAPIETSRKHYLRWDWRYTPRILQKTGIKHDYTLGYADRTGYRAGVAFPFRAFGWESKESLEIKLHPLIVMEASLLAEKYMGYTVKEAGQKIVFYHNQLNRLGGEFVLLWHNHELIEPEKLTLFKKFLSL